MAGLLMETQVYPENYFSAADVSIYAGDCWLDEINNLTFMLNEAVQPIFGYNSYCYDKVARGARYIQGSFRINFKEAFYLHQILRKISDTSQQIDDLWHQYASDRETPDQAIITNISNSIQLSGKLKDLDPDKIVALAKQIQDAAWDVDASSPPSDRIPFFKQAANGFDIAIVYGSQLNSLATLPDFTTRFNVPQAASLILTGVQLAAVTHTILQDGSPVAEEYSFTARDLDVGNYIGENYSILG